MANMGETTEHVSCPSGKWRIFKDRNHASKFMVMDRITVFFSLPKNGSIRDGIMSWKSNVDKAFEGVEECYICFSIVHSSNYDLPKRSCKTCHKKFHSLCLVRTKLMQYRIFFPFEVHFCLLQQSCCSFYSLNGSLPVINRRVQFAETIFNVSVRISFKLVLYSPWANIYFIVISICQNTWKNSTASINFFLVLLVLTYFSYLPNG